MATPPGGGGEVPQAGYYPDPSIPGYIRFWNGGSWVPGTSRPAPREGEALPAPPVSVAPQLAPSPAPAPSLPSVPAVEETGPVFLDADPEPSAAAQESAAAWHATTSVQTGFGGERDQRVSWGRSDTAAPAQQPPADPRAAAAPAWPQAGTTPSDPRRAESPQAEQRWDEPRPEESPRAEPRRAEPWQAAPAPEAPETSGRTDRSGRPEAGGSAGTGPGAGAAPVWPAAGGQAAEPAPARGRSTPGAGAPAAPAHGPAGGAAPDALAAPARLGGMPVTPSWAQQSQQAQQAQQASQAQQAPLQAAQQAPQPPQAVQAPQAQAQPFPAQASPQPQPQPQPPLPSQPQPQPQDPQSVAPWKPVVEDVFTAAARAQSSARPAGLGRRLVARLIDTVVLGAAVGAVSYPFVTGAVDHINEKIEAAKQSGVTVQVWLIDSTTSVQFGIVLAALLVLGALYEALPTSRWGRTLGKKLCGIEVRDIEAHEPPAFGAALRRWLVYSVLGLLVLGLLNVLWCLFDRPWRQCWHDKAARTFVAG